MAADVYAASYCRGDGHGIQSGRLMYMQVLSIILGLQPGDKLLIHVFLRNGKNIN